MGFMKRKVIKLGTSTLVASLPSKWTNMLGVKAGDEIEVTERQKELILSTEKRSSKFLKTIDLRKLNTKLSFGYLEAAYVSGVDELELLHGPFIVHYKTGQKLKTSEVLQSMLSPMIGFQIIEQSESRTVVKDIGQVSDEEMDNVLRRMFLLIKSMGEECFDAVKTRNKETLSSMPVRYDNIYKLYIYYLRMLNKRGYKEFGKTPVMYEFISKFKMIISVYRFIGVETLYLKKPYSAKALKLFEHVLSSFENLYRVFYQFSDENCLQITLDRNASIDVMNELKKKCSVEDALLMARLSVIAITVYHALKCRFNLEI